MAYSFVFARAVEAALEFHPPPRALWLRAVMAELERIANHLGDIGAICNDAAFSMMHAECAILREEVLRACAVAFGHRLMMDRIVPGGVAADLEPAGENAILGMTQKAPAAISGADRALRQYSLASGSHGRHRRRVPSARCGVRCTRLCRSGIRALI